MRISLLSVDKICELATAAVSAISIAVAVLWFEVVLLAFDATPGVGVAARDVVEMLRARVQGLHQVNLLALRQLAIWQADIAEVDVEKVHLRSLDLRGALSREHHFFRLRSSIYFVRDSVRPAEQL